MKLKKKISILLVICLLIANLGVIASAETSKERIMSDAEWEVRRAMLEKNMKELGSRGTGLLLPSKMQTRTQSEPPKGSDGTFSLFYEVFETLSILDKKAKHLKK